MKRTDIHRPSAIITEDYCFVAFECTKIEHFSDCAAVLENRAKIRKHMDSTGGTYSHHEHGGNCHICGACCVYTVLFYHQKTNAYIRTGQDCADKLDMGYGDITAFRTSLKSAMELHAGKRKAQAMLAESGLTAAYDIYLGSGNTALLVGGYEHKEENTVRDIVGKLVQYGKISENATNYLHTLMQQIANRPALLAQRAAEREAAAPCPTGRVVVTGLVLKVAEHASDFGITRKMTVKDDSGFIVWATIPSCEEVKRGDYISFKATITPSDKDNKFGFAKRPVMLGAEKVTS